MTAEQMRDSLLFGRPARSTTKMGGPSTPLTPAFARRTVYGKVSRYKLDEYPAAVRFPEPEPVGREALHDHACRCSGCSS